MRRNRSGQLDTLVDALGPPFVVVERAAFTAAVSLRISRFVGYLDPKPPDPVRRLTLEYCLSDTGRPVALLDQELPLAVPGEGWAVTVGGGGLFEPDAEWELWDDSGAHVKRFAAGDLPVVLHKDTDQIHLALAIDPESTDILAAERAEEFLRPLTAEDRRSFHR